MKQNIPSLLFAALLILALALPSLAEDGYTPPHEHKWEYVTHVDYTCTEDGYDLYVCRSCGEEERRVTDTASHRDVTVSVTEPDCTTGGEETRRCEVCGNVTVITTPELGHEWSEGETVNKPTLFTKGTMKFVCKRDPSHVMYEDIPSELSSSEDTASSVFLIAGAIVLAVLVSAVIKLLAKRKNSTTE